MQIIPWNLPVWSATLKAANSWMGTMISLVIPQDKIYGCRSWTVTNKVTLFVCWDVCFSWQVLLSQCCSVFAERWCWCEVSWCLTCTGGYFTLHCGWLSFYFRMTFTYLSGISAYLISYSFSIISKCKGYNLNSAWEILSTKESLNQRESKYFALRYVSICSIGFVSIIWEKHILSHLL